MNKARGIARIVIAGAAGVVVAVGVMSRSATAFNPQLDPPGFGLVSLISGQGIRVNVVCSEHGVGRVPPGPCAGSLMFHDMAGGTLMLQDVRLAPGEAASLPLVLDRSTDSLVGIAPCWVPGPGNLGHAIPSAEVFSLDTGGTLLFINPAAARLSAFADGSVRPTP